MPGLLFLLSGAVNSRIPMPNSIMLNAPAVKAVRPTLGHQPSNSLSLTVLTNPGNLVLALAL
jgi:hypothetical protein